MLSRTTLVLLASLLLHSLPASAQRRDQTVRPSLATAPKFDRYQVAAGTALLLKLQTPLDSGTTLVGEQVDAMLWSPIVQDGVELVPAGSIVLGRVTAVDKATEKKPLGSFAITFSIVEHAETGDRATMNTRPLIFEAAPPPVTPGKRSKARMADASLAEGASLVAVTAEPLVVRIPR